MKIYVTAHRQTRGRILFWRRSCTTLTMEKDFDDGANVAASVQDFRTYAESLGFTLYYHGETKPTRCPLCGEELGPEWT